MSSLLEWLVQKEPSFRKSVSCSSLTRNWAEHIDRTRLPSLYSDLSVQKSSNPEGYSANVAAWQAALTRAALAGQLPTEQRLILQTSEELLNALASPQYGRPSGLGSVIDDSVQGGQMIDLKEFLSLEKSIYSHSWIPSPWSVLRWGLKQVGVVGRNSYDVHGGLRNGKLVLVQALEEVSKDILTAHEKRGKSLTDRIWSRESFAQEMAQQLRNGPLTDQDMDVLLRYLSRDRQALSFDAKTVKFKAPAAYLPDAITSEDAAIASLKTLISNLATQVSTLDSRISALAAAARSSVKAGNKTSALSALRSKQLAERSLQQRSDTLHQLESVYAKLEQAVDQVDVVQAMQASTDVLKSLHKRIGGVERVEDLVEDLKEQMGKVDEVSQVLQEPLVGKVVLDEADVEDEFEEMEKEETRKREEREADVTKRRLEELENLASENQKKPDHVVEADLVTSTERLKRMSIDDDEQHPVQTVAEQTS